MTHPNPYTLAAFQALLSGPLASIFVTPPRIEGGTVGISAPQLVGMAFDLGEMMEGEAEKRASASKLGSREQLQRVEDSATYKREALAEALGRVQSLPDSMVDPRSVAVAVAVLGKQVKP